MIQVFNFLDYYSATSGMSVVVHLYKDMLVQSKQILSVEYAYRVALDIIYQLQ